MSALDELLDKPSDEMTALDWAAMRYEDAEAAAAELAAKDAAIKAARELLVMRPFMESINDKTLGMLARKLAAALEEHDKAA